MSRGLSLISDITNVMDLGVNLITTGFLYNNINKAKRTLLYSSIAMSALAVAVSMYQTKSIMDNVDKKAKELKVDIRKAVVGNTV